jgi:hypothetical protein
MLDILVPEVVLDRTGVVAIARKFVPGGMP